jgi:recombination associated protein RdgC
MWFKNLQIYRLPAGWKPSPEALETQLGRNRFNPCGPMDPQTKGWLPPTDEPALAHAQGPYLLLSLAVEHKLLPSSVVNQTAQERAEELAVQQGYPVGRKQMKELRERVRDELLPRAFTQCRRTMLLIDAQDGWLVVDAGNASKAEEALELLGKALDNFPLERLNTAMSPTAAMTEWLASGEAPEGFTIDRDCEVKSPVEGKATVRYVRHTLEGDDVRQHIAAGKLPTRLAMTWNDRMSLVLTEKQEVKRLAFLDVVKEQAETQAENAAEKFDADLAILTGELRHFIPALVEALGGEVLNA